MQRIWIIVLMGGIIAAFLAGCGGGGGGTPTPTPTPAASSATSAFSPASYMPGTGVVVTLVVTPAAGTSAYAVEDAPPIGWVVSNISDAGVWDSLNGMVKWGPFFNAGAQTFQYTVTPPAGTSGSQSFDGIASFDGANITISGSRTITNN